MSLASQVSLLATAIGNKIKVSTPITKSKVQMFGLVPSSSSAALNSIFGAAYFFGNFSYNTDATANTTPGSTSSWNLSGHWSGTYTFTLYYAKISTGGIFKVELSKDGGSTWSTLSSTLDTYASSGQAGFASFTAIAIPEGSDVVLKITVTGKNASASAYLYCLSGWALQRTGP